MTDLRLFVNLVAHTQGIYILVSGVMISQNRGVIYNHIGAFLPLTVYFLKFSPVEITSEEIVVRVQISDFHE